MAAERAGEARRDVAPRLRLALEERLADGEGARGVPRRPRLGQLVDRHVRVRSDERRDLALADRLASRPGRELVDLAP